ncbi:Methylesterase 10 [Linum grandiflorum]
MKKNHFVLVHGTGHGAWCWYKLVTLLKSSGHQVTALDLGGSGIDSRRLDEVSSISDYVSPLIEFMASLGEQDKVVLVGHSFGGISISLAIERFPTKVLAAVFVTAIMPSFNSPPANVVMEVL